MKNNYKRESISIINHITQDEEGIKVPIWKEVPFDKHPKKRFYDERAMKAMFTLRPCARNLLEYLIFNMPEQNYAKNDSLNRLAFIKYCKRIADITYKDDTVKLAFSELAKAELIIATRFRGVYQVNPLYFYNESEAKRKRLIKLIAYNKQLKGF